MGKIIYVGESVASFIRRTPAVGAFVCKTRENSHKLQRQLKSRAHREDIDLACETMPSIRKTATGDEVWYTVIARTEKIVGE